MRTPRVSLHDGFGGVVAELTTAKHVNRAWDIMQPSTAQVSLALTDPAIAECDPTRGRVLVIESQQYPYPWVGAITRAGENHAEGLATLQCLSLDAILSARYLSASADYAGTAGAVFASVLQDANGANDSGIGVSPNVSAAGRFEGTFPERSVYSALNLIARQTGHEWWVDYDVQPSGIRATANIGPARGLVRTDTALSAPGDSEILESAIDLRGAAYVWKVVGGQTATLQAYTERPRAARRQSSGASLERTPVAPVAVVHGFEIERAELGGSPLTRGEAFLVAEALLSEGAVGAAADVLAGRPPHAERVLQWRLTSQDPGLWAACAIGNVVRMRAAGAFLGTGLDAPVRIVSVQPM
jgi:hypothetical protein